MGVHGLWNLLSPVARPITPESLKDKRLAVDVSIWLYQFQMAIRDRKTGEALKGNHIQGTYRRIMKLLHWGIKPVFVFDGDAPMLKKRTIEKRKRRKEGAGRDLAKTAQQLLSAQLRNHAAENALSRRRNADLNGGGKDQMDTGEDIGEDAVYLEDLEAGRAPAVAATPSPIKKARKDAMRDEYALPAIDGTVESRVKMSDPRVATAEEFRDFIEDLKPEDLDVNSDFFGNLPTEVKYEILGELRIKTRQVNHRRNQEMRGSATAIDFSRAQIDNLMERNHYTQKLLAVTDELGTSAIAIPTRVAGTRNREYLLVKQDASRGGGWVLGVKNPELASTEPITIDTTTDESVGGHTDTDEFEEVGIDGNSSPPKTHLPTPDVEARRLLAVEAVRARYTAPPSRPEADPYLDLPVQQGQAPSHLFLDGNDDIELQEALFDSMETARQEANSASPAPPPFRPTSVNFPPQPSLAGPSRGGEESDDSLEYVDVPPVAGPSRQNLPPPPAPVSAPGGSDDSDAFDVVDVSPPLSRKPLPLPSRAPHSTLAPPAERSSFSPPPHRHTRPDKAQTPPERTLIDAVLHSDSESEGESPRRSSPPPRNPQPPESTPPAPDVTARDFGEEEFSPRKRPPKELPIEGVSHDDTALLDLRFADTSSKLDNLAKPSPFASTSSTAPAPGSSLPSHPPPQPLNLSRALPSRPTSSTTSVARPPPAAEPSRSRLSPPERQAKEISPSLPTQSSTTNAPAPIDRGSILYQPEPSLEPSPRPENLSTRRSPAPPAPVPATFKQAEATGFDEDFVDGTGDKEEEDEEMIPWSRSPTPPPGHRSKAPPTGAPQDLIDAAIEEASKGMRDEQEEYSEMARSLRNEDLESMREDATMDMARLLEQRNTEQRNADGITRQMASEIKEMLNYFGIPFLDAPQEAEAECASLLSRSLVDGVVTDDSDVFLFGASRVYRHMFDGNKYLECYLLSDLERELNLNRDKLVRLAYLLGGDYDDGLPGVGPVLARELVDEFEGENGLERFREWWKKVEEGKDSKKDTNTAWKRKFKKGHKALVIEGNWPKPEIARAYYNPVVNESDEPFGWGGIDLDGLLIFLARTMGWSSEYCMKDLKPLIDRLTAIKDGRAAQQKSLPDFFDPSAGHDSFRRKKPVKYASERLQNVIKNWKTQQASIQEVEEGEDEDENGKEEEEEEEAELVPPPNPKKRKTTSATKTKAKPKAKATKAPPRAPPKPKKSTAASRKKRQKELRDARAAANGGVYSSEEDLDADDPPAAPRQQAPRETKNKRRAIRSVSDEEEE